MEKAGILFGSIALLIQGAFPPWQDALNSVHYAWLFSGNTQIDAGRLLCQMVITIGAAGLLCFIETFWPRQTQNQTNIDGNPTASKP